MKRSEMIVHIKNDLIEKLNHKANDTKERWAEYTANELLDMIEGFDMLPPPNNIQLLTQESGKGAVLKATYNSDEKWTAENAPKKKIKHKQCPFCDIPCGEDWCIYTPND